MMSNPQGSHLQGRHRQHRRQFSTPTAHEAAKAPSLPAQALQRINAHRRGQSLDQRAFQMQQRAQDGGLPVTNQATAAQQQHQHQHQQPQSVLHEMYQQRLAAQMYQQSVPTPSVGECQPNMAYMNPNFNQAMNAQPMNNNLNLMQQQQQLLLRTQTFPPGSNAQTIDNGAWDMYPQEEFNMIPTDGRRLSIQSDISPNSRCPNTPIHNGARYFPITPAATPLKKTMGVMPSDGELRPTSTKEQSLSVSEAANASYMQRAKSLQGVAGTTFSQQKAADLPSPPNTATFEADGFDSFNCHQQEFKLENPESQDSSTHGHHVPSLSASSSFYSSPELAAMPSPKSGNEKAQKVPIFPATPSHRRMNSTNTVASIPTKTKLSPRVASIDNLNLDDRVHASINDTGVTIDEIASYISGPDAEDGKWVCLHPGCGRRFGRKENIKSHVQTHLGDRQYKCDHCNKCFVRGHDLKRHAKIHTGDKPYECLCGNVFARHDALTRHRQRGMCIGGYKGIVRKTTKRGRPKKHRPELEERQEKASRTRQKIADKSSSSDSVSGSSDTYHSSPPSEVFETMSLRGSSPVDNGPMFSTPNCSSLPPEAFTFTPPASPGCSTGNKPSPSHDNPRSLTPCTEDEMLPSSPSKQPLEKIVKESGIPFITGPEACLSSASSESNNLSSPHTAPTLANSTHESDLDIFINQDATTTTGFGDCDFPPLSDPAMAAFPDYVNTTPLELGGVDFFPGKGFTTGPMMDDDFFSFQFQVDDQPSEFPLS